MGARKLRKVTVDQPYEIGQAIMLLRQARGLLVRGGATKTAGFFDEAWKLKP